MTEQRSFKLLVRARMAKTGERYTTARAALLNPSPDQPEPTGKPMLRSSDASIRERTGRGWEEWFDLLDEWGAPERTHRDIAIWVAEQQGVAPLAWNAQAIAGSYDGRVGNRLVPDRDLRVNGGDARPRDVDLLAPRAGLQSHDGFLGATHTLARGLDAFLC